MKIIPYAIKGAFIFGALTTGACLKKNFLKIFLLFFYFIA